MPIMVPDSLDLADLYRDKNELAALPDLCDGIAWPIRSGRRNCARPSRRGLGSRAAIETSQLLQ
ncbi:hypothetical protein NJB18091_00140 [Mycobacterium marinum]|nr:hypothetical protein NJB18091_00140 [Mycobacterium marinum]